LSVDDAKAVMETALRSVVDNRVPVGMTVSYALVSQNANADSSKLDYVLTLDAAMLCVRLCLIPLNREVYNDFVCDSLCIMRGGDVPHEPQLMMVTSGLARCGRSFIASLCCTKLRRHLGP
jgi:hypothetical protein